MSLLHRFISFGRTRGVLAGLAACSLLAACGGSAPGLNPTDPASSAAYVDIQLDKNSVQSAGGSAIATVSVLNSSRQALGSQPVQVSVDSGSVVTSASTTASDGTVTATISVGGSDRSNRLITVTAKSGSVSSTATLTVIGTTLAVTPSAPSVAVNPSGAYLDFLLLDSASQPIAGAQVTYSSPKTPATAAIAGTTNAQGKVRVTYSPTTSGTDAITASAAGAQGSTSVDVGSGATPPPSTTPLDFTVQATPSVVNINAAGSTTNQAKIVATVVGANGALVQNALVHFRRGDGTAIASTFDRASDGSNPGIPTGVGGTASTSLIPGSQTSGNNGIQVCASVEGLATPATPGVGLSNCASNEKPVFLTFAGGALFVRIGTGTTIESTRGDLNYRKAFSVLVSDNAGQAVEGAKVSVQLRPKWFGKGRLVKLGTGWGYAIGDGNSGTPGTGAIQSGGGRSLSFPEEAVLETPAYLLWCPNEDQNDNGTIDSGEDFNLNGKLDPGQVAAVVVQNSGLTDSTGFVSLTVEYSKSYALWTVEDIEVRAAVGGSEGRAVFTYWFLASSTDLQADTTPPFTPSPFGTVTGTSTSYSTLSNGLRRAADCADPR